MKTAIIKTGFWMDDEVFELNSDTRLVYLCLLTNPQRDLLPAFRCSDRMLSAYTGYSRELIEVCRRQLVESGRIFFEEGYYIFTKQDFVKPSAGRDSSVIYEREYAKLPLSVKARIESLTTGDSTGTSTGSSTGHIYINKDINITKHNKETIPEEALELSRLLQTRIIENFDFVKPKDKDIENWAGSIEKIHRIDGYDWELIRAVIEWSQKDNFWKKNIRSGHKLRQQFTTLLVNVKTERDNKKVTIH